MPGANLLVIDDSPTVLKVIELALAQSGYTVTTATDDDDAMAQVRERHTLPDLILLDALIPNRDAVEICRRLAAEPKLAGVPVVVMTGARAQGEDLEARFAKAPNVVDYVSKPFSPEALQAVVSHAVGGGGPTGGRDPAGGAAGTARAGVKAAVEEALSRSADSAVAEARAFAAQGQVLAGDLEVISLSEVLALVSQQALGGILRIVDTASRARVEIFFSNGRIELAAAVGVAEEFLLGRFVVADGELSSDQLGGVLAERARQAKPPLFGADLIARGLIRPDALTRAMIRQTSELCYEALRWRTGFFQLRRTDDLPPSPERPRCRSTSTACCSRATAASTNGG